MPPRPKTRTVERINVKFRLEQLSITPGAALATPHHHYTYQSYAIDKGRNDWIGRFLYILRYSRFALIATVPLWYSAKKSRRLLFFSKSANLCTALHRDEPLSHRCRRYEGNQESHGCLRINRTMMMALVMGDDDGATFSNGLLAADAEYIIQSCI